MGHNPQVPVGFSKKKKKYQVMSPSPESRVPETGSDPPIGSGRDSGLDISQVKIDIFSILMVHTKLLTSILDVKL